VAPESVFLLKLAVFDHFRPIFKPNWPQMACHPGRETVFPSQKRPNLLILKLFVLKTAVKAGTMPGFLTRGFFQRLGITPARVRSPNPGD